MSNLTTNESNLIDLFYYNCNKLLTTRSMGSLLGRTSIQIRYTIRSINKKYPNLVQKAAIGEKSNATFVYKLNNKYNVIISGNNTFISLK